MLHCPANSQLHCSPASYCNASLTCSQLPNLTVQLPQLPQQPSVAILYCPTTHNSGASTAPCHNASLSRYLTAPLHHRFPVAIFTVPLTCSSTAPSAPCHNASLSSYLTAPLPHQLPVTILYSTPNSQLHFLSGFLFQYFTVPLTHSSTASPASVAILFCPTNSQLHCLTSFLSQYFTVPLSHSSTASPVSCRNTLLSH
jgi:hypothetical protein